MDRRPNRSVYFWTGPKSIDRTRAAQFTTHRDKKLDTGGHELARGRIYTRFISASTA